MEKILDQYLKKFHAKVPLSFRIDLLGSPAAGKTTLCNELLSKAHTDLSMRWVSIQEAKTRATQHAINTVLPQRSLRQRLSMFNHALNLVTRNGYADVYLPYHPSCSLEKLKELLMESFSEIHHPMLEALAEQWHDPDTSTPPRFERFNKVRNWVRELLFVSTFTGDTKILADNARLTKGMAELLSNKNVNNAQQIVSSYCKSPLAPRGVIHLSGNPETILNMSLHRQKQSGEINPGHSSRSSEEIIRYTKIKNSVNELAVDFFKQEKIAILHLNSETDLRTNTDLTFEFLNKVAQM